MKNIFQEVWRNNSVGKGYSILDVGISDSQTLRKRMFEIKDELTKYTPFGVYSMSRFDQQETTRFHQDGGPDFNILILGYESSKVKSRLYIADHVLASKNSLNTPEHIISEALHGREALLDGYVTKLPIFKLEHSYILIINNSKELGVMHKAIIDKNADELRIVNSIMLTVGKDEVGDKEQQKFLVGI